jgi:hypothetical protein
MFSYTIEQPCCIWEVLTNNTSHTMCGMMVCVSVSNTMMPGWDRRVTILWLRGRHRLIKQRKRLSLSVCRSKTIFSITNVSDDTVQRSENYSSDAKTFHLTLQLKTKGHYRGLDTDHPSSRNIQHHSARMWEAHSENEELLKVVASLKDVLLLFYSEIGPVTLYREGDTNKVKVI